MPRQAPAHDSGPASCFGLLMGNSQELLASRDSGGPSLVDRGLLMEKGAPGAIYPGWKRSVGRAAGIANFEDFCSRLAPALIMEGRPLGWLALIAPC